MPVWAPVLAGHVRHCRFPPDDFFADAACKGADTSVFFPVSENNAVDAKAICADVPGGRAVPRVRDRDPPARRRVGRSHRGRTPPAGSPPSEVGPRADATAPPRPELDSGGVGRCRASGGVGLGSLVVGVVAAASRLRRPRAAAAVPVGAADSRSRRRASRHRAHRTTRSPARRGSGSPPSVTSTVPCSMFMNVGAAQQQRQHEAEREREGRIDRRASHDDKRSSNSSVQVSGEACSSASRPTGMPSSSDCGRAHGVVEAVEREHVDTTELVDPVRDVLTLRARVDDRPRDGRLEVVEDLAAQRRPRATGGRLHATIVGRVRRRQLRRRSCAVRRRTSAATPGRRRRVAPGSPA